MKSLSTLMKLKQREMDALKRQQSTLEGQRDELRNRRLKLSAQLESEMLAAAGLPEMTQFFGNYAMVNKERQQQLAAHERKLEDELERLAQQIFERFAEVKKYEVAMANHAKRQREIAKHREQQRMDEVAIRGYIRRDAP